MVLRLNTPYMCTKKKELDGSTGFLQAPNPALSTNKTVFQVVASEGRDHEENRFNGGKRI